MPEWATAFVSMLAGGLILLAASLALFALVLGLLGVARRLTVHPATSPDAGTGPRGKDPHGGGELA